MRFCNGSPRLLPALTSFAMYSLEVSSVGLVAQSLQKLGIRPLTKAAALGIALLYSLSAHVAFAED